MYAQRKGRLSKETEDILVADLALTLGFSLAIAGGIFGINYGFFLYFLPISFAAVSLSFILHELMHKFVAQSFGAFAAFRRSDNGIVITLVTSMFGFLIGLPGATVIYAPHFTRKQEGYVSLAGPLTNFAVFAVFFAIGTLFFPSFGSSVGAMLVGKLSKNYLQNMLDFVVFISLYLAFFNMLPVYPLDGSKVLSWNRPVYFAVVLAIFALLAVIAPFAIISGLIFVLVVALFMSLFYKAALF